MSGARSRASARWSVERPACGGDPLLELGGLALETSPTLGCEAKVAASPAIHDLFPRFRHGAAGSQSIEGRIEGRCLE